MAAVAIQTVRPAGARYEALLLVIASLLVVSLLALYVRERGQEGGKDPLAEWQISAFDTLTGVDQAIYNALFTAKDDIPYLYEDVNLLAGPNDKFRWPNLQDFQDALLPPFFHDKSWEQNGSLKWTLYEPLAEGEMQGSTMYLGTDGTHDKQGSFLLVVGHVHMGFQNNNAIAIWWNAKNHLVMPKSGFRDSLILAGWREVVPHSGAQEVKRIFDNKDDATTPPDDQAAADKAVDDLFPEKK
jgi:hypothetical protein